MQPDRFYDLVPKDLQRNLAFRRRVLELGYESPQYARELWQVCKRSLLFYVNVFCWTYAIKEFPDAPVRPMITYPFQDEILLRLADDIGKRDIALPKSRDMGATWLCLLAMEWKWHFFPHQQFLLTSAKQELVDKSGNHKALFQKIDFIHERQPLWMLPWENRKAREQDRNVNHLGNPQTQGAFDGEATVANMGRGDRRTAIMNDERAAMADGEAISRATRDVTRCRINNSTPQAEASGAEFQRICFAPNANVYSYRHPLWHDRPGLHWSVHPLKAAGLYRAENGKLKILDESYEFPPDYPFVLDGKYPLRSPWFDEQVARASSDQEIAQELEIDFGGAGAPFFDHGRLEELKRLYCRKPKAIYAVDVNPISQAVTLTPDPMGPLKVWVDLDPKTHRAPAGRRYGCGCDVSQGTGASDSVASFVDFRSAEKVAEYASNRMSEHDFALVTVALCRLFCDDDETGALLIWEVQGPGQAFGKVVVEKLHYGHLYFARDESKISRKVSEKPGFYHSGMGGAGKLNLLADYRKALHSGEFLNPSSKALDECFEYVHGDRGPVHAGSWKTENLSEKGQNHGDRVIADALVVRLCNEQGAFKLPTREAPQVVPVGSFGWRREERKRDRERELAGGWA